MSDDGTFLTAPRKSALGDQWKQRGWRVAREVARYLRETYAAEEVLVFGSLVCSEGFVEDSDIDVAVKGVPGRRFFRAVGYVAYSGREFDIDLVDFDSCPPGLRAELEREGVSL